MHDSERILKWSSSYLNTTDTDLIYLNAIELKRNEITAGLYFYLQQLINFLTNSQVKVETVL